MKINIKKEDYTKYVKLELFVKQSKTPIIINGKIQEIVSNKNEFYIKTNIEQFGTNLDNIEAYHFKSQFPENNSERVREEVSSYLNL